MKRIIVNLFDVGAELLVELMKLCLSFADENAIEASHMKKCF